MASVSDIGPLDWRISITDEKGRPSPEFQRRWNANRNNTGLITPTTFGTGAPTTTGASDGSVYMDISTSPYTSYISYSGAYYRTSLAPDGLTITQTSDILSVPVATTATAGIVKPDGTSILITGSTISVPTATTSTFGLVKPDGTTITIASGVISSTGGGGSSATFGSGAPSSSTTPSVDGTPATNTVTGSATATITFTSAASRVAVLYLGIEQNPAVVVNTVTSPHLTWTRRAQAGPTQGERAKDEIEVWWAPVSSAVTSEVVTVTCNATPDNVSLAVVVVKDVADNTAPWDTHSSLPSISTNTPGSVTPAPVFSTTHGYGFAIAASYNDVARTETSLWSSLFAANTSSGGNWSFLTGFGNGYSTAQTNVTASLTSTDTGIHVRLVDVLTGYRGAAPSEGSLYFDTSTSPYTQYIYHSGSWHLVGSSGGGGSTTPTVRGNAMNTFNSSGVTISFPTGTIAGDLVVVCVGHGYGNSTPAGWTQLDNLSGTNFNGGAFYRIMSASDITTGNVSVSFSGTYNGVYSITTFTAGTFNKVVPATNAGSARNGSGSSSVTVSTDGTPYPSDTMLYFGSNRGGSTNTVSLGALLHSATDGSQASGVTNSGSPASYGGVAPVFSYSSAGSGNYQIAVRVIST